MLMTLENHGSVAALSARGRVLGPGERAAAIRTLEMQFLAECVASEQLENECVANRIRRADLRHKLEIAQNEDAKLRDAGL